MSNVAPSHNWKASPLTVPKSERPVPFSTDRSASQTDSSSRRRVVPPRRQSGGRGPGGTWRGGSANYSPYQQRKPVWPKLALIAVLLIAIIGGSVVVASVLSEDNDEEPSVAAASTPTEDAAAGQNSTPTTEETATAPTTDGSSVPPPAAGETATPAKTPTPTPPDPSSLTSPKKVADTYAQIWSAGAYDQLYELISTASQETISKEDFIARYEGIAIEAGIINLQAGIVSGNDNDLIFPLKVDIESSRIGPFTDENQIIIVDEGDDEYRVEWTPSMIFAGLGDGYVRWTSDIPQRGRILDRKGRPLAETGFISKVGVIPGQIQDEASLLASLSELLGMDQGTIQSLYASGEPNWFMPVAEYPDQMNQDLVASLSAIPGVAIQKWPARIYPAAELTAHVVGYLSEVTADELPELSKLGYEPGDLIGRAGVEAYAEQWLAGKRGGTLALIGRDESIKRVIGEVQAEPSNDVILTVDLDLQTAAYDAIGDQVGSAVVMDPNNGQILAMVSRPSYNPNKFVLGLTEEDWATYNNPDTRPLVNRATSEGYPTGSVFKLITASAGIVHLGYNADTYFSCPGAFSLEGSDNVWHDWVPGGQGDMNLHRAIYRSCNTVFYQIGEALDIADEYYLPDMARAFGFGERTGIQELFDIAGIVPDPEWKSSEIGDFWARGDAVNLAIGQGYFQASPLQLAKAYAAITNGGTLYRPYLVMDVIDLDGQVVYSGKAEEMGRLPLNADQIRILTDAMYDVIHAGDGTAVAAFSGAPYSASGKTGTAETGVPGDIAHGWFGSFAPSDNPRLTVVSMIEHGTTGSGSAAPVARKIYDRYFELYPG